jgi:hypothetical protein
VITLTELGDFLRLRSAVGDNHDLSPARHRSSLDVHNPGVDEEAARMGACGQLHLPTGRTCTREHGHPGSCDFVSREHMEESLARHRARDRW